MMVKGIQLSNILRGCTVLLLIGFIQDEVIKKRSTMVTVLRSLRI